MYMYICIYIYIYIHIYIIYQISEISNKCPEVTMMRPSVVFILLSYGTLHQSYIKKKCYKKQTLEFDHEVEIC